MMSHRPNKFAAALRSVVDSLARFARDEHGSLGTMIGNTFTTTLAMPLSIGLSFVMMQFFQSADQRDTVDAVGSLAANTVATTLCADSRFFGGEPIGSFSGPRATAVKDAIEVRMKQVAPAGACKHVVKPRLGAPTDTGSRTMDVELSCEIPCSWLYAGPLICSGSWPGHMTFTTSQVAVAMGCDAEAE